MNVQPVKIGIISFAHVHASSYANLLVDWPGVEVLAWDPRPQTYADEIRGQHYADQLGIPYVDTEQEFYDWAPDAVVVCSENAWHRTDVETAAGHGCQILCEKPLATTVEDGEAMLAACEDAGVFLMMAYPVHFATDVAKLKAALDADVLGDVVAATGTNNGQIPIGDRAWFTDPQLAGGGALVDHTVHVAELLDYLQEGASVTTVRAVANSILHQDKGQEPLEVETAGLVSISYDTGWKATIDCSWSQPDEAPVWGGLSLELIGTKRTAKITPFASHVGGYAKGGPVWLGLGENLDEAMLDAFIEGVRTGVGPAPDGQVGLRTLRTVKAAQESAENGGVVTNW